MISAEKLRSILKYDSDSGIFTWIKPLSTRAIVGTDAGHVCNSGYMRIGIDNNQLASHRLAWLYVYGDHPKDQIDHINGIKTDNRICNLRDVNHKGNGQNRRISKNNKSGFTGVVWVKSSLKWQAQIKANGKYIYLGLFKRLDDAISCRKEANIKHGFHKNHGAKQ